MTPRTRAGTCAVLITLATLLAACGGADDAGAPTPPTPAPPTTPTSPTSPTTPTTPGTPTTPLPPDTPASAPTGGGSGEAAVTPVGAPMGEARSLRIGPAGGSLQSADGALTLTVPAGALAGEQLISVQRINNHAPGARGGAWRITPEGLQSALPMTLHLQLGDDEFAGTALQALSIATQDTAGRWHAHVAPQRDAAARTLSVNTHHFSDWALLAGVQLQPGRAEVLAGQPLPLHVVDCPRLPTAPDSATAMVGPCREPTLYPEELNHWAVNGVDGGSAAAGTVVMLPMDDVAGPGRARYTAPAVPPAANPVAVSVDYRDLAAAGPVLRLVSNITVLPTDSCAWLHGTPQLAFELEMDYHASLDAGGGHLTMNQRGAITGRMQRAYDNELYGLWQGTTTEGQVALDDSFSEGDRLDRLSGSGAPAVGSGNNGNDFSGVQLLVDYRQCTYSIQGTMAVIAGTGHPGDVPVATPVGSFTRGNLAIGSSPGLFGDERMPPRATAAPEGSYAPGGLEGGRLFGGSAPTAQDPGAARIRWHVLTP